MVAFDDILPGKRRPTPSPLKTDGNGQSSNDGEVLYDVEDSLPSTQVRPLSDDTPAEKDTS